METPSKAVPAKRMKPKAYEYTRWSPTREKACKALIDRGLSAGQIAPFLGLTRNAVLGKAKRLGWRLGRLRLPRRTKLPQ